VTGEDTTARNTSYQAAGEVETPVLMVRTVPHWESEEGLEG